jgi:hypothetical protein
MDDHLEPGLRDALGMELGGRPTDSQAAAGLATGADSSADDHGRVTDGATADPTR